MRRAPAARCSPGFWALGLLALAGCEEEHPYTPFQVASALPSVAPPRAAIPPPVAAAPPSKFTPAKPIRQPRASRWTVAGQTLQAAPGYQLERALRADFDGDGTQETVAWSAPKDDPLRRPELWLFPAEGAPKKLFTLPGFVPTGPTCALQVTLLHTGPQTVTLDAQGNCEARQIARAPLRSLAVLAPRRQRPLVLALRAADAGPGERMQLAISSPDRDGDGRDDVALSVSVQATGSGTRAATAEFVWYDREAGASRDDSEPGVSMAQYASTELVRAKGKNTSQTVQNAIQNLKRLYGAVCNEGGTPRLFDAEGNGFACGRLTTTFSRSARAEITALLKNQRVLEAVGVLVRDGWFGHAADAEELRERRALFGGQLRDVPARLVRRIDVSLPARGSHPRFSPLEFSDAELLIQSANGVRRFGEDGNEHELAEEETPPAAWPLSVTTPQRKVWTGVVHSCDRAEVTLSFSDTSGAPHPPEPTRVLAPRPGSCRGGKPVSYPSPVPLGFSDGGLSAWVGGSWIGPHKPNTRPRGSALSRDGRRVVLPTPLGLLVSGEKHALWQLPEPLKPERLSDCTIRNDGKRVACVSGSNVVLLEPASPKD